MKKIREIKANRLNPTQFIAEKAEEIAEQAKDEVAAYFPILVSTRHAVRALPTLWEDSVRTLGGPFARLTFATWPSGM